MSYIKIWLLLFIIHQTKQYIKRILITTIDKINIWLHRQKKTQILHVLWSVIVNPKGDERLCYHWFNMPKDLIVIAENAIVWVGILIKWIVLSPCRT